MEHLSKAEGEASLAKKKGRRPKPTPQEVTGLTAHTIHPSSRALATAA